MGCEMSRARLALGFFRWLEHVASGLCCCCCYYYYWKERLYFNLDPEHMEIYVSRVVGLRARGPLWSLPA